MLKLKKGAQMKIDKQQILELFNTEKIADDNTGVYNVDFKKLLDKLSISMEDKQLINILYKNDNLNTEKSHLNKISTLLDNKIELFSDDFWELFFFRKHSYYSAYPEKKWNEFNESYEQPKDVKKRVKVLKGLNISNEQFENFFKQLSYVQDTYLDFWFSLKKKNKDKFLDEVMKKMILKYGDIDKNETQKASMLSYFKEVKELEILYIKNKDTPYKRDIENELSKFKTLEKEKLDLFEEMQYHSVVYRKNISINENALIYELGKDKKSIEKLVKIITQFLTNDLRKFDSQYNESKYYFTMEGYSEENLNEKIELVKKAFKYLPELLMKQEYVILFKDDIYINNETNQFLKQYIKSAEMYKNLSEKLPEQKNKEIKKKI